MARMSSSSSNPGSSIPGSGRPGLLSRLWQAIAGAPVEDIPPAPPLFRSRPVPPPAPRGPGLPPDDEILLVAPPVPDPARQPRLTLIHDAEHPDASPYEAGVRPLPAGQPATADAAAPPEPAASVPPPSRQNLTPVELQVLGRIRVLLASRMAAQAKELLESHFKHRPGATGHAGLPVYLVESYRCAVLLDDLTSATEHAAALRPLIGEASPLLEVLVARAAMASGNRAVARTAWLTALSRAPGLPDAIDWLTRHPLTPDGGTPAPDLILGPPPELAAAPPPLALSVLPQGLPPTAPGQWLRDVAIRVTDGASSPDAAWETARALPAAIEGDVAVLLRDPDDIARPAQFTETVLALYALARTGPAPLRLARLYAGVQPWAARATFAPQAEMLAVLFPGLRVTAGFDGAVRERAVIVLDGGARDAATGTMTGGILPLLQRHTPEARARVFAAFGIPGNEFPQRTPGRQLQALYLPANPAAAFAAPARDRLIGLLQAAGFEVNAVDMALTSWRDQVRLAAGADLLFGVHGPALAAAVWAHPQARVLELFPPGVRRYENQLLAEAAGLGYLGLEGVEDGGYISRNGERGGPASEQAGGIVSTLPWHVLNIALAPPKAA